MKGKMEVGEWEAFRVPQNRKVTSISKTGVISFWLFLETKKSIRIQRIHLGKGICRKSEQFDPLTILHYVFKGIFHSYKAKDWG